MPNETKRARFRQRLLKQGFTTDVLDRLIRAPTPHRLYNALCALALLAGSRDDPALVARALDLLRRALETGFSKSGLRDDPDLKSLGATPEFRKWIEEADGR